MEMCFITFRSVTYAQRGEKALSAAGIHCSLLRTPRWMEEQGCGYALKIWSGEILTAVKLLREARIQLRKVYAQGDEGEMEEVQL